MGERKDRLIIFAKYPVAGAVKTRLIPALGADGAAELYRAFLLDAVERWSCAGSFETVVAVSDATDVGPLRELLDRECVVDEANTVDVTAQRGDGLGDRMANALSDAFADGCRRVCLIGSDHPTLPHHMINRAFERDAVCDLVLGETSDGGYWLVGMDSLHRELFDGMPFSSPQLYAMTLRRAVDAGLSVRNPGCWYDVDDEIDLERLLGRDRGLLAADSRTRAVVDGIRLNRRNAMQESSL